jgi:predicted RNA-binding protein with PIN domain
MYTMGNQITTSSYHFEKVQAQIQNKDPNIIFISTLDKTQQHCLIQGTLSIEEEIKTINEWMKKRQKGTIVVYGKNHSDPSVYKKFKQLTQQSKCSCYIYLGGLFEWLLLQEIYGCALFPTQGSENDLLKFR